MLRSLKRHESDRRGAIIVLVALLLPALVIMTAFAVDVAWMQLVRTELRTATDAAARAAAKELSLEQDVAAATAAAIQAASLNLVAGQPLQLAPGDIQFGSSIQSGATDRFAFVAGGEPINGVRVLGRRTGDSLSGDVDLFFGKVLGTNSYEPTHTANTTIMDRDICIVIDRSGSMGLTVNSTSNGNGQNCGPMASSTRFAALADAIQAFLGELDKTHPEEQVALVSYSTRTSRRCNTNGNFSFNTSNLDQTLTLDYTQITDEMDDFMRLGIGGGTSIGAGLQTGIQSLQNARPFAIKTIVLMTDGRHNSGINPESVASTAASQDIIVHTVTFSAGADIPRMEGVAQIGGGQHFHADSAVDLAIIFREIARTLPVLITD